MLDASSLHSLPVYFAPLQGYTDADYRQAHCLIFGGVEGYYTPFVRIENGGVRNRDLRDVDPDRNVGCPVIPQLIASVPDELRSIVAVLRAEGYRRIDINLGCPFPMLTKRWKGAGLLPCPEQVEDLLRTIEEFPDVRFSVKMRLGLSDAGECLALLPVLNAFPLCQVVMHPRLGIQQYKGVPDEEAFARFYEVCPFPLIYNGDLTTVDDLYRIGNRFPRLSGIMVGRGMLKNPALAETYRRGILLSAEEYKGRLQRLHDRIYSSYENRLQGEHQLLAKMKSFWEYPAVSFGYKAAKRIQKASCLRKYSEAVERLFQEPLCDR